MSFQAIDFSVAMFLCLLKLTAFVFLKALKLSKYDNEPMLRSCGISISTNFAQVEGRVLPAPRVYLKHFNGWIFCFTFLLQY